METVDAQQNTRLDGVEERLTSHELGCERRQGEIVARFVALETQLKGLKQTMAWVGGALTAAVSAGLSGFFLQA